MKDLNHLLETRKEQFLTEMSTNLPSQHMCPSVVIEIGLLASTNDRDLPPPAPKHTHTQVGRQRLCYFKTCNQDFSVYRPTYRPTPC